MEIKSSDWRIDYFVTGLNAFVKENGRSGPDGLPVMLRVGLDSGIELEVALLIIVKKM